MTNPKHEPTEDDRMPLSSTNVLAERLYGLRELFPEAFVEGKVDIQKLRFALGQEVDDGRERYGLTWAGKAEAMRTIQVPSVGTLLPTPSESVDFETSENIFIEGDNLEVLKLLQKSYYGKVKLIYIDPPYNTGNEFIYPDNFREGLQDYLKYSGQVDADGLRLSTNTETNGRFHSKWLSMIWPRLFLARNLLRDDGVLLISIDDHEAHNLRLVLSEIFGEENIVASFVWQKKYSRDNRPVIGTVHEYILMVARDAESFARVRNLLPPSEESTKVYRNPNNDPRGRWRPVPLTAQAGHATANQFYEIVSPSGVIHKPPEGRCWSPSKETFEQLRREGRIWFGKDGSSQPNLIRYLSEIEGFVPWTWLPSSEVGHTDEAKKELYALLGKENGFETPKPTRLLRHFIQMTTKNDGGDIVMDFFAGTGTTGDAVLQQNHEDGGNRRFVLVQLPEPTSSSEFPTIASIAKRRLRGSIEALKKRSEEELGFQNGTKFDLGFRVFKLTSSNFKIWDGETAPKDPEKLKEQIRLFADNLMPGRTQEAVLYELLLKAGLPLTAGIETQEVHGAKVYSVAGGLLLICLEDPIKREVLRGMSDLKPQRVLCLDHAFRGNDKDKVNALLEMRSHGIEFRTV